MDLPGGHAATAGRYGWQSACHPQEDADTHPCARGREGRMAALPAHSRCLAHSGRLPVISFPFEPLRVTGGATHSFCSRDSAPWRGERSLSYHGWEPLTHCDMCQLVCPGTNEASLPPLSPCHGQSASSSLAITKGEHPPHVGGALPSSSFSSLGQESRKRPSPPSPALPPLPSPRLSQLGP